MAQTQDEPLRILVVAAHPDDIEFGCAGSVAVWTDEGAHVTYVIVTDGSTGTNDRELAGEPLATIRHEETLLAAQVCGVTDVHFLGFRDGYVEPTLELRKAIARQYRTHRPHRFVVMDPDSLPGGFFVNHPDHRAVGQACLDVTITAGTTVGHFPELLEDEGLEPWRGMREIYVMGPPEYEHAVDITAGVERKIEALKCHGSQIGEWDVAPMIRNWTAESGRKHGFAHAETFRRIVPIGAE